MENIDKPAQLLPLEKYGTAQIIDGMLMIGEKPIYDMGYGYRDAEIYVRRMSGLKQFDKDGKISEVPGMPIAEIIISVIGNRIELEHKEENSHERSD